MNIIASLKKDTFKVREACNLEIHVQLDCALKENDQIEFQFPHSWSLVSGPTYTRKFQYTDPKAEHYISVATVAEINAKFELSIQERNLYYPEGAWRHGRLITAELVEGEVPAGMPIRIGYENTFAPYVSEMEELWFRVNGQKPELPPILKVLADEHKSFRIIVPSHAEPKAEFEVLIVSLDRFDNASGTVFKDETLVLTDGTTVAENLHFSGNMRIRTKMEEPGVYRFRFRDIVSNAIRIDSKSTGPYWGDIHIHTKLSQDGQGTDPYAYAHNVSGLDFAGVTDHWDALGPDGYRVLTEWAEKANIPGAFVAILGDERNPKELNGHHNVYFRDLETMESRSAILNKDDEVPVNSFNFLRDADPSQVMIIPHHTGITFGDLSNEHKGNAIDWNVTDDKGLRPVMEIYSHHGQSEIYNPQHLLAYEWNRMRNPERRANTSVPGPYYAQDYWMQGKRIGVIASSDDHNGQGGRRHGGITAVFTEHLTRKGIFKALRRRQCYATTGERILLEFAIDNLEMGECGKKERGKSVNINLNVWGTDKLLRVDILRHRFGVDVSFVPVVSIFPKPENMDAKVSYQDVIDGSCVYYARILQEPLEWPAMAWASPIWIDVKE